MKIGTYFTLEEFQAASRAPLTNEEAKAAEWWARNILDPIRAHYGLPLIVSSFVRPWQIDGPNVGQTNTDPHSRHSVTPGNAVDIVIHGLNARNVALDIDSMFPGTTPIWAKLVGGGGTHVHLTRLAHPGSLGGVGIEAVRADGHIGVDPIPGRAPLVPAGGTLASTGAVSAPPPPGPSAAAGAAAGKPLGSDKAAPDGLDPTKKGSATAAVGLMFAVAVGGLLILHAVRK